MAQLPAYEVAVEMSSVVWVKVIRLAYWGITVVVVVVTFREA